MLIYKLKESGYDEAIIGFSLSYNTSLDRAEEILPKYAFGIPGENKFLESIIVWWDVTAPRYWWQEADTYRVGSTKQSESTMHTLLKKPLTQENFQCEIPDLFLDELNKLRQKGLIDNRNYYFQKLKNCLPEGFLQRRIWCLNYKSMQNIYTQRRNHRLQEWQLFCNALQNKLEHPEFIVKRD